jgi:hypothetical protein
MVFNNFTLHAEDDRCKVLVYIRGHGLFEKTLGELRSEYAFDPYHQVSRMSIPLGCKSLEIFQYDLAPEAVLDGLLQYPSLLNVIAVVDLRGKYYWQRLFFGMWKDLYIVSDLRRELSFHRPHCYDASRRRGSR